ncbi:MAG TPA: 16S rRNA (uracil(1498)-N(3))-methyltransferase [Nitrospinae bacterium]|nr:16S rRNA (uracil(1498)-N(3))-methyltransferase [Nitrospinota bacterium]HBA27764.1 16S rRNA (uracil(1498)-N(3))-methyltransferase [Nitrospinota bacterium]
MKKINRFFVGRDSITDSHVKITGDDAEQIRKVLRMKEGEEIFVLDGHGWEYKVQLTEIKKRSVMGEIKSKDFKTEDSRIKIILGQGIPKGEKMDFIVQKATELGVTEIVPLKMERCVVRIKDEGIDKVKRWQRIAKESSEQSLRRFIPSINTIYDLKHFCDKYKDTDLKIVFYEEEKKKGLKKFLNEKGEVKSISIIVGPEGGLSEKEIEIANSYGFISAGLGQRILRTDTVALSALSIIQFLYGDLG